MWCKPVLESFFFVFLQNSSLFWCQKTYKSPKRIYSLVMMSFLPEKTKHQRCQFRCTGSCWKMSGMTTWEYTNTFLSNSSRKPPEGLLQKIFLLGCGRYGCAESWNFRGWWTTQRNEVYHRHGSHMHFQLGALAMGRWDSWRFQGPKKMDGLEDWAKSNFSNSLKRIS